MFRMYTSVHVRRVALVEKYSDQVIQLSSSVFLNVTACRTFPHFPLGYDLDDMCLCDCRTSQLLTPFDGFILEVAI